MANRSDLTGKVIVVTGGTQGQGADIVQLCAEYGAKGVVFAGRNEENGTKRQKELSNNYANTKFVFVPTDVSKEEDCRNLIKKTEEQFTLIDGLVNCAGNTKRGTIEDTKVEDWDMLFNTNLRSAYILTQEVQAVMKKNKTKGSIVNISSVQALGGATFCMAYACTKAAMSCLTRNNAVALQPYGIRVNAVNMGWTITDNEIALQKAQAGDDWLATAEKANPAGRLLQPRDISVVVAFILSDQCCMNGADVPVHPEFITGVLPQSIGKTSD